MVIEAATVGDNGGACLLAASFIFLEMISKPVKKGAPIEGMMPQADGKDSAFTTGDTTAGDQRGEQMTVPAAQ